MIEFLKKNPLIIIVLLVVVGGGYLILNSNSGNFRAGGDIKIEGGISTNSNNGNDSNNGDLAFSLFGNATNGENKNITEETDNLDVEGYIYFAKRCNPLIKGDVINKEVVVSLPQYSEIPSQKVKNGHFHITKNDVKYIAKTPINIDGKYGSPREVPFRSNNVEIIIGCK